jgi:hypothetical protein
MSSTPLVKLLSEVPSLNDPSEPFTFAVVHETIVGTWNVVGAVDVGPGGAEAFDRKYSITVTLDEKASRYNYVDTDWKRDLDISTDGTASASVSGFRGKEASKSVGIDIDLFGLIRNRLTRKNSQILVATFDTKRIKAPLFDFLKHNGWKAK